MQVVVVWVVTSCNEVVG